MEVITAKKAVKLVVNGKEHTLEVGTNETMVEVLRRRLRLTGTKIGYNRGECGACTVLIDGEPILSCLTLAIECEDREILTIEGLEDPKTGAGPDRNQVEEHAGKRRYDAFLYDRRTFESLDLKVIDGQKEIIPSVSVFPTLGHSPGGQSVEADTAAGKAIITGFCCTLGTFAQTEAMKRKGWEISVPLIHNDVREAYDSVLKVKHRANIIIAVHDPTFVEKEKVP